MNFQRQLDILDPDMIVYPVTVIGLGGIGRPVSETLAEMGCKNLTLYDPDSVEEHNRPNQAYQKEDIGKLKVDATKEIINQFAEWCETLTVAERFEGQRPLEGIVISGVDSMKSRQVIWQAVRYNLNVPLYIDGRIGGEYMQIHAVRPCRLEDIESYEKTLYSDENASRAPCVRQNIIYVGKIIGGLIALQLKKWLKQEQYNRRIDFDLKTLKILGDEDTD